MKRTSVSSTEVVGALDADGVIIASAELDSAAATGRDVPDRVWLMREDDLWVLLTLHQVRRYEDPQHGRVLSINQTLEPMADLGTVPIAALPGRRAPHPGPRRAGRGGGRRGRHGGAAPGHPPRPPTGAGSPGSHRRSAKDAIALGGPAPG